MKIIKEYAVLESRLGVIDIGLTECAVVYLNVRMREQLKRHFAISVVDGVFEGKLRHFEDGGVRIDIRMREKTIHDGRMTGNHGFG